MNIRHWKMSRAKDRDNRRCGAFVLPRTLLAGLFFVMALTPRPLLAQADTAKAPLPSNRYLLVVETSRSMQRRADGVVQTAQDLLMSGLGGQLRRGDTLGVWTYNENLYAGRFPLQTWSPESQKDITLHTLAFLKGQKYEKQARFDKVLPALSGVIKASPLITVILISSAEDKIHGTPFDDRINGFYLKWHDAQQKARMPFVTVLRGQEGVFADFTVNAPPWPVQMPLRPPEPQHADPVHNKLAQVARAVPPPTAPPLIISGKKAQPEAAPAPKLEASGVSVQAPAPAPEATSGSKSPIVNPAGPVAQPAQIAKSEAAPPVPDRASPDLPTTPSPATMPVPELKAEVVKGPETKPVAPAPSKAEVAAALPVPAPEPGRAVPTTQEVVPGPSANTTGAASGSSRSSSLSPPSSPLPVAPAQTATAIPTETLVGRAGVWIAGLVLAGVAISFVFLLRRRARATQGASLITQSFERKNKP